MNSMSSGLSLSSASPYATSNSGLLLPLSCDARPSAVTACSYFFSAMNCWPSTTYFSGDSRTKNRLMISAAIPSPTTAIVKMVRNLVLTRRAIIFSELSVASCQLPVASEPPSQSPLMATNDWQLATLSLLRLSDLRAAGFLAPVGHAPLDFGHRHGQEIGHDLGRLLFVRHGG